MGHVGLLPQSSNNFKLKGKNFIQRKKILQDAIAVSKSGPAGRPRDPSINIDSHVDQSLLIDAVKEADFVIIDPIMLFL